METRIEIARRLLVNKYIKSEELAVWLRSEHGETIYQIRREYPKPKGLPYAQSTLYLYVQRVNAAIAVERMLAYMVDMAEGFDRSGVTLASGSRTRHASDPTAEGRRPDEESSWNVERLKALGLLDRWSRKRL